jgi:glutamyl-tRNA synthetase
MTVVTRFAPSPTGYLHIGGARTALFNWLFSKNMGGIFRLRIEDTDRARSTQAAVDALIQGLEWMGIKWDGEIIYQYSRASRHAEIAHELVARGKAYYCYTSAEELVAMRAQAEAEKRVFHYHSIWRDREASEAEKDVLPSIRLKAPQTGTLTLKDSVQGEVSVENSQLDDMVLLRSDGTPTYLLAVVVDDHDMEITDIIRGDDHFTNSFRQALIYNALDWEMPKLCHIPLIHGADGAKLSKRHGALGVEAYEAMGFLPEAMRNYLLRLGWSHGDNEIISTNEAISWFSLSNIGKSPSRFDMTKLESVNAHYLRTLPEDEILSALLDFLKSRNDILDETSKKRILSGLSGLKARAKTLLELAEAAKIYRFAPENYSEKAMEILNRNKDLLLWLREKLAAEKIWQRERIESSCKIWAEEKQVKIGEIAGVLRAALSGSHIAPSTYEMLEILGAEESLKRIDSATK